MIPADFTPPRFDVSTSSVVRTPQSVPHSERGFACISKLLSSINTIVVGILIANAVGLAGSASLTAIAVTNIVFLLLAAIALPKAVSQLEGRKKIVALVVGYLLITSLIALNIFGLIGSLSLTSLSSSHLAIALAIGVGPYVIQELISIPNRCRKNPELPSAQVLSSGPNSSSRLSVT